MRGYSPRPLTLLVFVLGCEPSGVAPPQPPMLHEGPEGDTRQKPSAPLDPIDISLTALRRGSGRLVATADVPTLTITLRGPSGALHALTLNDVRAGEVIQLPTVDVDALHGSLYLDLDAAFPGGHSASVVALRVNPSSDAAQPREDGLGRPTVRVPTPRRVE